LKQFNENVSRISELHSRSINITDEVVGQRNTAELEDLVADTSALSDTIKRRIKALERQRVSGREGQIKKQQVHRFGDYNALFRVLTHSITRPWRRFRLLFIDGTG
jgi:t-SNARE complex subunit (syntaxin)